jgi:outer membrane immunogenic protein
MKCSLGLAIAFAMAGMLSAHAADLPARSSSPLSYAQPPQQFSWAGFYVGINGGYAWGGSSWSDPVVGADSGAFNTSGGLIGAQLGYNWQAGAAVFGLETDADWMNVTGTTTGVGGVCATDGGGACQTQQSWVGTTRARLGFAFDNFMPYVTGGAAYGNIQTVQPGGTTSSTNLGWTAGGGVEVALGSNWSAKAEYLHIDLGSATFLGSASGTTTLVAPVTDDLVRGGLNYRF